MTGTGKTTLAKYLLREYEDLPVFVFDYKGLINTPDGARFAGYKRFKSLREFCRAKDLHKIYAPKIDELNDTNFHEAFFKYAFVHRKCQVYVDEAASITSRDYTPFWYKGLLQRGRELKIRVFSATQRPIDVSQLILSESEHTYTFKLKLEGDREKVERATGISRESIARLKKGEHKFYYSNVEGEIRGPLTLKILKGN
jgi:DNA helicase HerA-like ATPase